MFRPHLPLFKTQRSHHGRSTNASTPSTPSTQPDIGFSRANGIGCRLGKYFEWIGFHIGGRRGGRKKENKTAVPSVSSAAASTHAPPLNRKLSRGCSFLNAQVCRVQSQIRFQLKLEYKHFHYSLTSLEENLRCRMARDTRTCSFNYAHTPIRAHGLSTSPRGVSSFL